MKKIQLLINQLESYIPDFEKTNPKVSNSTIGWQIDHSLLVINAVLNQLRNSNPKNYTWKFNRIRIYIQITNKIPRGRVKVPKAVNPIDTATLIDLKSKLDLVKKTSLA